MPIEVRELVIKARVEEIPPAGSAGSNGTAGRSGALSDRELQTVVDLCTEAVMKIIKKQNER